MTLKEVMAFLESKGSEQTKKVLIRHGAREPFFGVKIADLKVIQKKVKYDHNLALQLYNTGNSDAMYLAAMICEPGKFTIDVLEDWVSKAYWYMISDFTVAWAAAESNHGRELALKWMNSEKEFVQSAGWATYASILSITPNDQLNLDEVEKLLEIVQSTIHQCKNRVRYAMNNFVIAVGAYVPEMTEHCKSMGIKIGKVKVDMGGTSCKVPEIKPYIEKVEKRGSIGKKRKRAIC